MHRQFEILIRKLVDKLDQAEITMKLKIKNNLT